MRRGVGQHHDHRPGHGGPEHPGTKPAPPGLSAVGQDAHKRVKEGVPQSRNQQEGPGQTGAEAEHVGVEIRLEQDHGHEDEIRGRVSRAVARLFDEREFLGWLGHNGSLHRQDHLMQIAVAR